MVLMVSTIVDISCGCLLIVAPIAVVQKIKLNKLGTFRSQHNELRNEVNKFAAQNEKLKGINVKLERECTNLQGVTAEYETLAKQYGDQIERLVGIVKENGEIQAKIKKSLQTQVMQQALESILKSDTNEDFAISQKELQQFKLRMKNIPGVIFDEPNFDKLFQEKKLKDEELHLKEIMQLFRNLMDDIPENDNVFHLTPQVLVPRKSFLGR
jgi:predicted RNA-binding protein